MKQSKPKKRSLVKVALLVSALASVVYVFYGLVLVSSSGGALNSDRDDEQFFLQQLSIEASNLQKKNNSLQCNENGQIKKPAPDFIIAGVQKGGTSALRGILLQNPNMTASKRFEPHYFDKFLKQHLSRNYGMSPNATKAEMDTIIESWVCDIQQHYMQSTFHEAALEEKGGLPDIFFFEKTPSYVLDPDVPSFISSIFPTTKIVMVLRNPVDRAYSHYKMEREKRRVKSDFETVLNDELRAMRRLYLTAAPPLVLPLPQARHQFGDYLRAHSSAFRIPKLPDDIRDDAHKEIMTSFADTNFIQRGMYAPQLERWMKYFSLGESLLVLKFEDLKENPAVFYKQVLDFLRAPYFELKPEDFEKAYQTRGAYRRKGMVHLPLSNATRMYLEMFHEPYNKQLTDLLDRHFYGQW